MGNLGTGDTKSPMSGLANLDRMVLLPDRPSPAIQASALSDLNQPPSPRHPARLLTERPHRGHRSGAGGGSIHKTRQSRRFSRFTELNQAPALAIHALSAIKTIANQALSATPCCTHFTNAFIATEPGFPDGCSAWIGTGMCGSSASTSTLARSADKAV
jgi:hypothetical protein